MAVTEPTYYFWDCGVGNRDQGRCHLQRFLKLGLGGREQEKMSHVTVSGVVNGRSGQGKGFTCNRFWVSDVRSGWGEVSHVTVSGIGVGDRGREYVSHVRGFWGWGVRSGWGKRSHVTISGVGAGDPDKEEHEKRCEAI